MSADGCECEKCQKGRMTFREAILFFPPFFVFTLIGMMTMHYSGIWFLYPLIGIIGAGLGFFLAYKYGGRDWK